MRPRDGGYTWGFVGDTLICRKGGTTQHVASFARVARTTEHHDEALRELTDRINELVQGHEASSRRDDGRELSMILTPDGWMLAYTQNEHDRDWSEERSSRQVLELEDGDDQAIREKLGLV